MIDRHAGTVEIGSWEPRFDEPRVHPAAAGQEPERRPHQDDFMTTS
ncbi:hypothetical protein [Nonomuraea sp. NPDC049504]